MHDVPPEVLAAYGYAEARLTPIISGHINRTLRVDGAHGATVIQRLNPIFGPEVHDDIEAVTAHIAAKGLPTPRLVRTSSGALYAGSDDGSVWRVLTFVEGHTHLKASSPRLCHAAGALLGRFHGAVADLEYTFKNRRGNIHDTPKHLNNLREALAQHAAHPAFPAVSELAGHILDACASLPDLTRLPKHVVHGDPKLSNILFASDDRATCLVDFDTMGAANLAVELGDALRSWCNRTTEDDTQSRVDLGYFESAMSGYAETAGAFVTREEISAIPAGVQTIALELAARFAADALDENYFGWDKARFARASDHNLQRARAQYTLAMSMGEQHGRAEEILGGCFGDWGR